SQQEFENALGAGGTNIAAADNVFNQLSNGTGSVTLDDLKSALQGAGRHGGHHHMHVGGAGDSDGSNSADGSTDPFMQALEGASSTSVTNSDGSTTTSITYADGSKVTMTTPAASSSSNSTSSSATSSYNWIEQMIQREAQSLTASHLDRLIRKFVVMAGLVPAIHVFICRQCERRGCPAPVSAKASPGHEFTRPA